MKCDISFGSDAMFSIRISWFVRAVARQVRVMVTYLGSSRSCPDVSLRRVKNQDVAPVRSESREQAHVLYTLIKVHAGYKADFRFPADQKINEIVAEVIWR